MAPGASHRADGFRVGWWDRKAAVHEALGGSARAFWSGSSVLAVVNRRDNRRVLPAFPAWRGRAARIERTCAPWRAVGSILP